MDNHCTVDKFPIALPIEMVLLRSGHLSTPYNRQTACPQRTVIRIYLYIITSESGRRQKPQAQIIRIISQTLDIKFVAQIVCPLLCFVVFCLFRECLVKIC